MPPEVTLKSRSHRAAAADAKWTAVVARDTSCDGTFVYAVSTTGVYCRPSCPSRQANRVNVSFYDTAAHAEAAGFRACKRCKPNDISHDTKNTVIVERACRVIETSQERPALAELAAAVGLSPFHFHRVFKSVTGVTPNAYALAHRQKRIRNTLATRASVTDAIFDAGYNSGSRFYASATEALGMTPSAFRRGGTNTCMMFAIANCSLGAVLVAATKVGVSAVLLGDDAEALLRDLQDRFPNAELIGGDKDFNDTTAKVIGYVENPQDTFKLPLDVRGTVFQHKVWEALRKIPAGATATYSEIAAEIGKPAAVRAVASACAANPVAVAIPCHRVVRTNGDLSGYRWGIERKRKLLNRESKT